MIEVFRHIGQFSTKHLFVLARNDMPHLTYAKNKHTCRNPNIFFYET